MKKYSAALADLRYDIATTLPSEVIIQWNTNSKSPDNHRDLLESYKRLGTMVSSDSSGLSKLSQKYTLPQVMKIVSRPKEIIHSYGKAIGGEAVGIWAADNTQMFYNDTIKPEDVLTQMLAVQGRDDLPVRVGMGLHFAEAYHIGGGIYGPEADRIEEVSENETDGGEIVVTQEIADQLPENYTAHLTKRDDLDHHGTFYSLKNINDISPLATSEDEAYPTPFNKEFFSMLTSNSLEELEKQSFEKYMHEKVVVVLWVPHEEHHFLLDHFTAYAKVQTLIQEGAEDFRGDVVKSTGALGIVLFDDPTDALSYSTAMKENMAANGFKLHVGLSHGELFVFPLDAGGRDIAGNPLNIASKLSEDSGMDGIIVHDSVIALDGSLSSKGSTFSTQISGVTLEGLQIA